MKHRNARGFSLMEMLVVIAIIGTLSLVSVPAFINYQRTMKIRGALRTLAADIRNARQMAISQNVMVRLEFTGNSQYRLMKSEDEGRTWTRQALRVQGDPNLVGSNIRNIETVVTMTTTFVDDTADDDANAFRDLDFRSDGTVWDNDAIGAGRITLSTDWESSVNRAVVTVSTTGQLTTVESKV